MEDVTDFIAKLKHPSRDIRRSAAETLAQISSPAVVLGLIGGLQNIDPLQNGEVRGHREAARALGEIKNPSAVPALITALQSRDVQVRQEAAWALGEIKDARAVPGLSEALGRWDKDVRQTAAVALGEIGDRHGIPALIGVLLDNDEDLRLKAARALSKIAASDPAPTLRLALPMLDRLWFRAPAFEALQHQILTATAGMKNLPLPASAPRPDRRSLPRPAAAPSASVAEKVPVLVPPARGWWQRLRRALRGY